MGYKEVVLADTPVGYWRLAEPSGTTCTDSSGYGNHGTYGPVPLLNQPSVVQGDASASFSQAAASQVSIPYAASLNCTAAWTIECWVYVRNQPAAGTGGCFFSALYPGAEATVQMCLGFDYLPANQGKVFTGFYSGPVGWKQCVAPQVSLLNQWVHWVGIYNGSTLTLYQNSVLVATLGSVGACPAATSPKWIGRRWDADEHPDANIDEVAVYNYALSPARIQAHFAAAMPYQAAVMADFPRAYWRLGDTTGGATANDASGNGWHATYGGGVTWGQNGALAENDRAVLFDGSTGYASAPAALAAGVYSFTLEAWVKTPDAGTARRRIISQQNGGTYWLMALTGNMLDFGSSDDAVLITKGPALNDNRWHHILVSRNEFTSTAQWWVDGVLVGTQGAAVGIPYNVGVAVELGRYGGGTEYFAGLIDEIAFYTYALSAARVQAHYAAGSPLARWDGVQWVRAVPQRWNGSAWVPAQITRQ